MTTDRIAGGALVVLSLLVIWQSSALPLGSFRHPGPAYIPILLALLLLFFGFLLAAISRHAPQISSIQWTEWRHAVAILAACIFAGFALERLGYRCTVLLIIFFLLKSVEKRGWFLSASLALAMAFCTFYVFYTHLGEPVPQGQLG